MSNTEKNQEIAASKAGMDPSTARRYLSLERLPSELKKERRWRTREDPFGEVWDAVQRQIQESPGLEAKTLFDWLQREYPGRFSDGQIRTLQRRIKLWRVTDGPAQEVYFGQSWGSRWRGRRSSTWYTCGSRKFQLVEDGYAEIRSPWNPATRAASHHAKLRRGRRSALRRLIRFTLVPVAHGHGLQRS